ncbi:RGS domain-containing protein [Caenorhabditis elegans]|uniref:RGS domain-containing protein n=1 Tax=Caenorhabditis elegans TaxID=6239 RepID=Q9XWT8_CAEEL|nr:RGS domain-containing protein [Caenorhabditis elegans]CAA21557.3 RGS domain-containing protein [Caenorhabditis elegans]
MDTKEICERAAVFRIAFFEKLKFGWNSQPLDDTKMVHYLYRIFYMAPNDQEVQIFEWHNFFDTYHDFPMRVHIDNTEDHKKCALMTDIIEWFSKPEKDRNALRRLGKAPNQIYCLGCKTVEEKEFLSLMALQKLSKAEKAPSPVVQPVSGKAAKRLGMSKLEMADAALNCQPSSNNLLTSVIGPPLRRSASALLFPLTDLLEQEYMKEHEYNGDTLCTWEMEKSSSAFHLNSTELPKPKLSKTNYFPSLFGEASNKKMADDGLQRKHGTVDTPILKESEAQKKSIAKRKRHERLLKASEWCRVTDEDKATLVEIKIRQRLLLIQHYIRGWQDMGAKDATISKWLIEDISKPLHTRRFASFEYHHFIPSHVLQIITKCICSRRMKLTNPLCSISSTQKIK